MNWEQCGLSVKYPTPYPNYSMGNVRDHPPFRFIKDPSTVDSL